MSLESPDRWMSFLRIPIQFLDFVTSFRCVLPPYMVVSDLMLCRMRVVRRAEVEGSVKSHEKGAEVPDVRKWFRRACGD